MTIQLYEGARVQLRNGDICKDITAYYGRYMKWTGTRVKDGHLLTWKDNGAYSHVVGTDGGEFGSPLDVVEILDGSKKGVNMEKLELVTREVRRIVTLNCADNRMEHVFPSEKLNDIFFNTISGRHEIECFFAIEFEQEQVDAWTTVQNIIDDVMNLWVSPITDTVVKGANLETVQRLQRQLGESQAAFNERVLSVVDHAYQNNPLFVDVPENPPIVRTEINPSKSGIVGHVGEEAVMPSEVINRIERADVERFQANCTHPKNAADVYQTIATKSAIYPGKGTPFGLMYAALGLAEAGEVQNKVKKAFRDDVVMTLSEPFCIDEGCPQHGTEHICRSNGRGEMSVQFQPITPERRAQIIKELGGALWYIAAVCDEIGATMSEVALQNLDELCGRGERNTLRGDGDNR